MRVLVVEDYEPVRSAVVQALTEEATQSILPTTGEMAFGMPSQGNTTRSCSTFCYLMSTVSRYFNRYEAITTCSVLLLTALDEVDQRIKGLDEGADDYLVKPFAIAELMARVRALVRRRFGDGTSIIEVGELRIDTSARLVHHKDKPIELTAREYGLLELLARRRGKVVTREEVWKSLYDFGAESSSNVVDVYIGYLRKKLDPPEGPSMIQTRRGMGYVLTGRID